MIDWKIVMRDIAATEDNGSRARLNHQRLVRQLVRVRPARREIFRKLARDGLDALDDPGLELPLPEIGLHVAANCLPALAADLGVDAAVGDDLDLAVGEQEINQHAIVVGGVPDPQMREDIERASPRRMIAQERHAVERAFHGEAHLARMPRLAGFRRSLDLRQHLGREHAPRAPMMLDEMFRDASDSHALPAPRGAAAAETAAATAAVARTPTAPAAPTAAPAAGIGPAVAAAARRPR